MAAPSSRPSGPLPSTIWRTGAPSPDHASITVHHLTLATAKAYPGLIEFLHREFSAIVEEGATYPQEDVPAAAFASYFLAADVFVGIARANEDGVVSDDSGVIETLETLGHHEDWSKVVAGFYYVKPNYPGRSSHICNAGFVVPPAMRGRRYGVALAKSYLHYAPKLGYQASVFNLVYVNNVASVRIWEALGFTKAGRIPSAGRLKRKDGDGEEYVDAWIFYKKFVE